jgi:signal transduction histidine kinase
VALDPLVLPLDGLAPRGDVAEQLDVLRHGDHVCAVYDDQAQQLNAVVPFVRHGLERGECCAYIADGPGSARLLRALAEAGVDVARERDRGALLTMSAEETYFSAGAFEPAAMLGLLDERVTRAVDQGFTGFRASGEMTWALGSQPGCDRLVEYEALLNDFFRERRVTGLCQYPRVAFPPAVVRDVLRTHPLALLGEDVCPNPFYERPELVLKERADDQSVEWMIEQVRRWRAVQVRMAEALDEQRRLSQDAAASIQARDEFLSVAAHELRTPITSVKANAQLLERVVRRGAVNPVQMERLVSAVVSASDRLTSLTDDLLDVARMRSGQLSLRLEPLDVGRLVEEAIARHWVAASETHRLMVDLPGEPCLVQADRRRFDEVIENLLGNAVKYSPEGGAVWISLEQEEDGSHLVVRDEGIGLPPGSEEAIFEPFGRAPNATRAQVPGLGLGLHICRGIVEGHRGRMWAESAGEGQGTTMHVVLPCRSGSAASA